VEISGSPIALLRTTRQGLTMRVFRSHREAPASRRAFRFQRDYCMATDQNKNEAPQVSDAELLEAQRNLETCLEALDQGGEEGLEQALDKLYPPTE